MIGGVGNEVGVNFFSNSLKAFTVNPVAPVFTLIEVFNGLVWGMVEI